MILAYLNALHLLRGEVRRFLFAAALVGFAWDGMRSVLFNLFILRLGYGPEFVGLANAAGALAFAVFGLPVGVLGTRWGHRRMIAIGVGLLSAGLSLFALAEFLPPAWQMIWLPGGSVLANLGLALFYVNSLPFLMGATGLEERNHAFAAQIALAPLAGFAGALVAGVLPGLLASRLAVSPQDPAVYRWPLWFAALLLVPGVVVLWPGRQERARQAQKAGQLSPPAGETAVTDDHQVPYGLILVMALVVAFRFAGRGTVATFFNVYLDDALATPTALIGALAAAGQLVSVPAALAAPLVVARWGLGRAVVWGTWGMGLALLPLALIPHWAVAGLGFTASTTFLALSTGPVRVYSQEIVTARWWGTMSGALMVGTGLSTAAVALAGGYGIAILGYRGLFLIAAGLTAAGALLFSVYFRVPRGEQVHQPSAEEAA
jgi:MFS family permease